MSSTRQPISLPRRTSRAQVALGVRQHGAISRVQLAKVTGLSLASTSRIVDELLLEGMLIESGTAAGQRGRPRVLLEINPDGAPAAGVWLAPEAIEIAVANPALKMLSRRTVSYNSAEDSTESVVESIVQGIQRCAEAAGKDPSELRGVGVSVAGLVDPMLDVVDSLTNRRGWENVPITRMLQQALGIPVFADNDVRAAALVDQWLTGVSRDHGAIYILVCEGIGAAIISEGELQRGLHGAAGLLGHMTVDPNGPVCGCGKRGCLEVLASDMAFVRGIWPTLPANAAEMSASERVDLVRKGMAMADSGDAQAVWSLVTVCKWLGMGISDAISLLDPQSVYLCGTMFDTNSKSMVDLIRREVLQRVWTRVRGVDIKSLPDYQDFLLRGSVGLVFWQPFQALQEEGARVRTVALSSGRATRHRHHTHGAPEAGL